MPSKETLFVQATKQRSVEADWLHIPDSTYHMCRRVKGIGVLAHSSNGRMDRRDKKGKSIDQYHAKPVD